MHCHLAAVCSSVLFLTGVASQLIESERIREYHARNYTWPPKYVPDTVGWKNIMNRRFAQLERIRDTGDRYDGYLQTVTSAIVAPNFTESGWGLTRAPDDLMDALRKGIRDGLEGARLEHVVDVIEGPAPLFIDRPDLTKRVLEELTPMHEKWSGQELEGFRAYGFRLYQNQSALHMHVDKPTTHIISCILHIDHSEDSEAWPIIIEDFQGNTNEVILESGDMLFYESSKCFHGRPKKFNGSWYSSIFVHYHPVGWDKEQRKLEAHYAVPPHWRVSPSETDESVDRIEMVGDGEKVSHVDKLQMVGTAMKEPGCEHDWCNLHASVKMYGPGEKDMVITTGHKFPLWGDGISGGEL